jgi:uncharacterized membrane protein YphA (DoxX/SURF4 family)
MNHRIPVPPIPLLRWALGLVVLWQSYQFVASTTAAAHFARTGLPAWVRYALGGAELIAAILFLLPAGRRIGGYLLLAIFVLAAFIHILHGTYDVGGLLVYTAATLVCLSEQTPQPGACHDR